MALDSLILDSNGQPARRVEGRKAPGPRAALGGGWDAGEVGRRLSAIPTASRAINTLIRSYGQAVLARSRYLAANNPYAASARESYVSAMVGQGIVPAPQLDDPELKATINQVWHDWTDEADADWVTDFYGLQSIVAGELFEAGECFIRFRQRRPEDGLIVPLQLQVIPAEMLDIHWNLNLDNGNRIECGIEFDAIGRRRAYHFWQVYPGTDQYFGKPVGLRTVVPADQVLHIYRPIRAGQIRGIPHTLSMITTLASLDLYDDAELERKRIAACFSTFVTQESIPPEDPTFLNEEEVTTPRGETQEQYTIEPGATVKLAPGEDIKFAEPADVGGTYELFQYRMLLRAAAGAMVPYSDMTGDLRRTSFGSIRAGLIAHRRRIETLQQSIIIYQFCQRVYTRWWTEAVLAGALPVTPAQFAADQRTYQRADWIPPRWDWIDPLKDLQAEQLAVQNHFKSRTAVIKGMGLDPLTVDTEIMQDLEREKQLGIPPAVPEPVPSSVGGPSAEMEPLLPFAPPLPREAPAPRAERQDINITLTQPPPVAAAPTPAAAPPRARPQVIHATRDIDGNLVATMQETLARPRVIRTSRNEKGDLTATVEEIDDDQPETEIK
jgi:lambda family phage portal protein